MKKILNTLAISATVVGTLAFALPAFAESVPPVPPAPSTVSGAVRPQIVPPIHGFKEATSTDRKVPPIHGISASTTAARLTAIQERSYTEIQNRETTLNNLVGRIGSMKNLSDSEKSSLSSGIQSELGDLSTLKGNIGMDNSTTTARADSASITKAYRIYALVVPQTSIVAASDRVNTLVTSFNTIVTKLQTRITAAQTAGNDVSALSSALSDLNAKLADATTQAAAATSEVKGLVPDNGDKTILASNTAALKDARAKLETASKDLQAARKDAETIAKGLQSFHQKTASTTNQ